MHLRWRRALAREGIRQVAVMGDGEAATGEFGEEWLDIAQSSPPVVE